jgi:hypothetical protein
MLAVQLTSGCSVKPGSMRYAMPRRAVHACEIQEGGGERSCHRALVRNKEQGTGGSGARHSSGRRRQRRRGQ